MGDRRSQSVTVTATSSTRAIASSLRPTGMRCSGNSPDGRLVEFVECRVTPFFVGTQAHPEFKSRPDRPHPLFLGLIKAADVARRGPRAAHHRSLDGRQHVVSDSFQVEGADTVFRSHVFDVERRTIAHGETNVSTRRRGSPRCGRDPRDQRRRAKSGSSASTGRRLTEILLEIPAGTLDVRRRGTLRRQRSANSTRRWG